MLFSPLSLGELELSNRLVMAPLTRLRSGKEGVPGPLVVEHYRQRASLGLIISEGTYPSPAGRSYPGQPGIVTPEQIAGWKKVTDAVHAEGGRMFAQIMHGGRVSHEDITGGHQIVAPSAVAIEGETRTYTGKQAYPVPHELSTDELPGGDAGNRDGVAQRNRSRVRRRGAALRQRLPSARIPRPEQPTCARTATAALLKTAPDSSSRRSNAVVEALGANRVGIRISPEHNVQGIAETDAADVRATYEVLVDTHRTAEPRIPEHPARRTRRVSWSRTCAPASTAPSWSTPASASSPPVRKQFPWSQTAMPTPWWLAGRPSPTRTSPAAGAKACR